jgi:hypothetical protein
MKETGVTIIILSVKMSCRTNSLFSQQQQQSQNNLLVPVNGSHFPTSSIDPSEEHDIV